MRSKSLIFGLLLALALLGSFLAGPGGTRAQTPTPAASPTAAPTPTATPR